MIRLESGERFRPKPHHKVECDKHHIVTTWGALDAIQKLAVEEGIDTADDMPCLLQPKEVMPNATR